LAYFGYEDLPADMSNIHLEYFQEAADWLSSQPFVIKDSLGVIGTSTGGDMALNLAWLSDKVTAVATVNASHYNEPFAQLFFNNQKLPTPAVDFNALQKDAFGRVVYKSIKSAEVSPSFWHPIESSSAKFLLITADGDLCNDSLRSGRLLAQKMKSAGKGGQVELLECVGAGHLLEPPYFPFVYESFHRVYGMMFAWGGEPEQHVYYASVAWRRIVTFFKQQLLLAHSQHGQGVPTSMY